MWAGDELKWKCRRDELLMLHVRRKLTGVCMFLSRQEKGTLVKRFLSITHIYHQMAKLTLGLLGTGGGYRKEEEKKCVIW